MDNLELEDIVLMLKRQDVSQGEIAARTGISEGHLTAMIKGRKVITEKWQRAFNKAFGAEYETINLTLAKERGEKETKDAIDAMRQLNSPPTLPPTSSDALNKLIDSNQTLAEATRDIAAANTDMASSHKLLAEMLYKSNYGTISENVSNLNALVVGIRSVLMEVATGKQFSNQAEVVNAMHIANERLHSVETADIATLKDIQDMGG